MNLIAILDFFILIFSIGVFFLFVRRWKYRFSVITECLLISIFIVLSFYYLSNFLEWSEITDILVNAEDYVSILAPVLWLFFIYAYIQKNTEKELRKEEKNVREAYKITEYYKDLFSHDIRNILQNILLANNLIEFIEQDKLKEIELRNATQIIKEQIIYAKLLVSNVTNLSILQSISKSLVSIDIIEVLNQSINQIYDLFDHRNINIIRNFKNQPMHIFANHYLEQIFDNILINAIKHNINPNIEIQVNVSSEKNNDINFIKIEFIDNGIGIIDERKKLIFHRVESNQKYGMGTGLSLIKNLIEEFKGYISVANRVELDFTKGSVFKILFPKIENKII